MGSIHYSIVMRPLLTLLTVSAHLLLCETRRTRIQDVNSLQAIIERREELPRRGNLDISETHTAGELQRIVREKVGKNYVGVAVELHNSSPFSLVDPKWHEVCGWQETGTKLPGYRTSVIPPHSVDAFLFHNYGWTIDGTKRNSCGSLSWQLKHVDGSNFTVSSHHGVHAVRLFISWRVHFSTCATGSHNQVSVKLDRAGDPWKLQSNWFQRWHNEVSRGSHNLEDGTRVITSTIALVNHVKAMASITQGCEAILRVWLVDTEDRSPVIQTVRKPVDRKQGRNPQRGEITVQRMTGTHSERRTEIQPETRKEENYPVTKENHSEEPSSLMMIVAVSVLSLVGLIILVLLFKVLLKTLNKLRQTKEDYIDDGKGEEVMAFKSDSTDPHFSDDGTETDEEIVYSRKY